MKIGYLRKLLFQFEENQCKIRIGHGENKR